MLGAMFLQENHSHQSDQQARTPSKLRLGCWVSQHNNACLLFAVRTLRSGNRLASLAITSSAMASGSSVGGLEEMEFRGVPSTAWCCDRGVAAGVVLLLFLLLPVRNPFWVRGGVVGGISGGGRSCLRKSFDCTSGDLHLEY